MKIFGLQRFSKYGVGKKIGNKVWFHSLYKEYCKVENINMPTDIFDIDKYDVIRFDLKTFEIVLIKCDDFFGKKEPCILNTRTYTLNKNNEYFISAERNYENNKNKLIYHHKWLFVKDDFPFFNVSESIERSITWKTILGTNKSISSKIGYSNFWDKWLEDNNIEGNN